MYQNCYATPLIFNLLNIFLFKKMSFKSRPQTKKTGSKRKWDQGETATDSVAYANVKIYSISGGNLDKKEFGLTGMLILANLL